MIDRDNKRLPRLLLRERKEEGRGRGRKGGCWVREGSGWVKEGGSA